MGWDPQGYCSRSSFLMAPTIDAPAVNLTAVVVPSVTAGLLVKRDRDQQHRLDDLSTARR